MIEPSDPTGWTVVGISAVNNLTPVALQSLEAALTLSIMWVVELGYGPGREPVFALSPYKSPEKPVARREPFHCALRNDKPFRASMEFSDGFRDMVAALRR